MPIIPLNVSGSGNGVRYAAIAPDSDFVVEIQTFIQSYDREAFYLLGDNHSVTVRGFVAGETGIFIGNSPGSTGSLIQVDASGGLFGSRSGATLTGAATVANMGDISGGMRGLNIRGSTSGEVVIDNDGTVRGGEIGIFRGTSQSAQTGAVKLTNDGVILGGTDSYNSGSAYGALNGGVDLVTNRGLMIGDVRLGYYSDLFDNVGGTVRGTIWADAGDDTIRPGAGAERIYGGADIDTLDFRSGGGLRVDLQDADGSGNTGRARNDSYEAFENLRGSRTGNDTLRGDGQGNELYGEGGNDLLEGRTGDDGLFGGVGNDRLSGGPGVDILQGGAGVDTLSGGTQVDAFSFASPGSSGDRITDFEKGTDVLFINRSGFGADLALGLLSASRFRLDGARLDSNDRFIFRASDDTLWFDPDGSGRAARVLIADFQTNLTLAASDLQVV